MNKTLRTLFVLFLIQSSFFELNAQVQLDLKKALQYTLEHHSKVKQAEIDIKSGLQTIREARSVGLPQISATSTVLNNVALRTSLVPAEFFGGMPGDFAQIKFGTNWNGNAGIQLNQMLFNKQWLLALEGSRKSGEFYDTALEITKEEVVYETAKLYYQIQAVQTQQGILEANLYQIVGLKNVTDKQYQNGFAKKIDVERLQVQESNLNMQISNLELQVKQLEQALKFAMQMPLETDIILTDSISINNNVTDKNITKPTFRGRPALNLFQVQKELYDLDARRWKAGAYPTISLFGSYTYEWQSNNLGDFFDGSRWNDFSQIGIHFNFPIFDGFFRNSQMQIAELNNLKADQDYLYTMMAYQLQHEQALSSLQVNQNNLKTVTDTRNVAERVYEITQKRYKQGIAPITELLDAETSMREAQSNFITTLAQIKLAEIDLMHANGKLMEIAK